ncbi:MAG TPA: uracil-DNA glycosylase family protein [Variovorax sp.]|nr:uracil-DNA glycosylase family protein [Variovorax sp.]
MSDSATARPILRLDARQREMLEAMGIQLWWPEAKAARPAATERAEPAPAAEVPAAPAAREIAPPAPTARPAPAVVTPAAPPVRVSPVLPGSETLLADAPRLLYGEAGPGGWLIVADMAPDMLGSYPQPLAGDEGRLLENMLRALQLQSGGVPVHLVRLHRGSALPGADMPRPYEEAFVPQCEALAPRVVLAMGPLAAQALLRRAGPIGKLRGEAQALEGPLAGAQALATYHPAYLLRNGADKAKAWADLCLAAALFERAGA